MLTTFFDALRKAQVPVSLREYLTLIEALDQDLAAKARDGGDVVVQAHVKAGVAA